MVSFVVLIAVGTGLLLLPGMRAHGQLVSPAVALFTATSAATVTGLTTVDTGTYFSTLGQVAILLLVQVGGFGITTLGSLLLLVVSRRLGLSTRLAARTETGVLDIGDVRRVMLGVALITVVVEAAVGVALAVAVHATSEVSSWGGAAWFGLFHAVTAWNNAGFALHAASLLPFHTDAGILLPISAAVVLGGLGFPVLLELLGRVTPRRWALRRRRAPAAAPATRRQLSLHARVTLVGSAVLLVGGALAVGVVEWTNPATLGPLGVGPKLLEAFFSGGVTPRTAGFAAINYAHARPETLVVTDVLMFIGAGSASTAGGIKITTVAVLAAAVVAEVRGYSDVSLADRRIAGATVRQALTVTLVFSALVLVATLALMPLDQVGLDRSLFEAISALSTVGLSAGLTPVLNLASQLVLVALMVIGRVGPLTLATALALRSQPRAYRLAEGRPMIG